MERKILFLLTSCINVSTNKLFFDLPRSVFSISDRYEQTKNTIKSIHEKMQGKNYQICLVDNNITPEQFSELSQLIDHIIVYDNKFGDSPCKSLAESSQILFALDFIEKKNIEADLILKISGRYCLNNNFNIDNFHNEKYTIKEMNNFGIRRPSDHREKIPCTVLYGVPKNLFADYKVEIQWCFNLLKNGELDVEKLIFSGDQDKVHKLNCIGAEGFLSCFGEKVTY